MKYLIIFISAVAVMLLMQAVQAATIGTPIISSPSSGSSFNKGVTFTVVGEVACGTSGSGKCKSTQLTLNLPSGLSTSSLNPQGCGDLEKGASCSKSWIVSANTVGAKSITVSVSTSDAGSGTSSAISVTVNAVCGDSVCDTGETSASCQQDCPCPSGQILCSGSCTTPVCTLDANCDDGNATTSDVCNNPNTCTASCSNTVGLPPAPTPQPSPTTIYIQVLSPSDNQTLVRGEKLIIKTEVTGGGNKLTDADVIAEVFSQKVRLHDDGLHGDEATNDGIYAAEIEIKQFREGSYKILISAFKTSSTYAGAAITREVFVNPKLDIAASFNEPDYSKGEKMVLTGEVRDSLARLIKDGNLDVEFSFDKWKSSKSTSIGVNGNFLLDYLVSFGDPEGKWDATVFVKDQFNNSGSAKLAIDVKTPVAGSYLYVKFLTPVEDLTYSRGETIKLAVEVTEGDKLVSNADISVKTPKGDVLRLNETAGGAYSAEYSLGYDEPVGNISLVAQGIKYDEGKFKAGGNFIPIQVRPANVKLDIIEPSKSDFVEGETVTIAAKALYPDGTSVSGANVFVESPSGEKIYLKEVEKGLYEKDYVIKPGEEGSWQMQLAAEDAYGNSASAQKVILVGQITLFYLLLQYWYLVAIGSAPFAYLGYRLARSSISTRTAGDMENELKRIVKMKEEAQIKYFKKGSIEKGTYESLMKEYERKESDVRTKLRKLKMK